MVAGAAQREHVVVVLRRVAHGVVVFVPPIRPFVAAERTEQIVRVRPEARSDVGVDAMARLRPIIVSLNNPRRSAADAFFERHGPIGDPGPLAATR